MSRSKIARVMIYFSEKEYAALKKFAKKSDKPMTQVIREGLEIRMSDQMDPYSTGLKEGLNKAMEIAQTAKGGQMKFPSGKSFGQMVSEEIEAYADERLREIKQ